MYLGGWLKASVSDTVRPSTYERTHMLTDMQDSAVRASEETLSEETLS